MVAIDAVVALGIAGVVVYVILRLLLPSPAPPSVSHAGHWVTVHYDVDGVTRIVLQKVAATGAGVLDEHVVATIPVDDPAYDATFLTAMASARERRALFEAEEG
jgi:hypothetical protein